MKKKISCLLLIMILASFSTLSVFAETVEPQNTERNSGTVSEDAVVQSVYEMYLAIVDAMSYNNYSELKQNYENLIAVTNAFTEAQSAEWQRVLEENVGLETALGNLYHASYIIYTIQLMDMYQQTPNVKTANEFVEAYDKCVELGISINTMNSDVASVYQTAKTTHMPTEDTLLVYAAYIEVVEAIESTDRGEIDDAVKAFNAIVDIYNELTPEEFEALACLLELESEDPELTPGEYVAQVIFADWMDINILDSFDKVYSDYINERNAENAEALIQYYDLAIEGEMISKSLVEAFFPDIDTAYAEAKITLEEDGETYPETEETDETDGMEETDETEKRGETTESKKETKESKATKNNDNTPKTGDGMPLAYMLSAFGVAGVMMVLSLKKRNKVR